MCTDSSATGKGSCAILMDSSALRVRFIAEAKTDIVTVEDSIAKHESFIAADEDYIARIKGFISV
jgi:hypothetical protein